MNLCTGILNTLPVSLQRLEAASLDTDNAGQLDNNNIIAIRQSSVLVKRV